MQVGTIVVEIDTSDVMDVLFATLRGNQEAMQSFREMVKSEGLKPFFSVAWHGLKAEISLSERTLSFLSQFENHC